LENKFGEFIPEVGNSSARGTKLEIKLVYVGQYKYHMDLFNLPFERKWTFYSPFLKKKYFTDDFYHSLPTKKIFAGNIKVLGGPDVASGLDVAQDWSFLKWRKCGNWQFEV